MDAKVRSRPAQKPRHKFRLTSLAGTGLPERMRSTTFAVLGLVAAAGLALVAMFALPGWPLLSPAPLPSGPVRDHTVGEAVALSPPSSNLIPGGYGSAVAEGVPAPNRGSAIEGETGGRNPEVGVSGPAAVVKAGVGGGTPDEDAPAPAPVPAPEASGESAPAAESAPVASAPTPERGSSDGSTPGRSTAGSEGASEKESTGDETHGGGGPAPSHSRSPDASGHGNGHAAAPAPSPAPSASAAANVGPPSSPPGLSGDHGNGKGHGNS
jgi:hypothetical protein